MSILLVSSTTQAFLFLFLTFILVECFDSISFIFGKRYGTIRPLNLLAQIKLLRVIFVVLLQPVL